MPGGLILIKDVGRPRSLDRSSVEFPTLGLFGCHELKAVESFLDYRSCFLSSLHTACKGHDEFEPMFLRRFRSGTRMGLSSRKRALRCPRFLIVFHSFSVRGLNHAHHDSLAHLYFFPSDIDDYLHSYHSDPLIHLQPLARSSISEVRPPRTNNPPTIHLTTA